METYTTTDFHGVFTDINKAKEMLEYQTEEYLDINKNLTIQNDEDTRKRLIDVNNDNYSIELSIIEEVLDSDKINIDKKIIKAENIKTLDNFAEYLNRYTRRNIEWGYPDNADEIIKQHGWTKEGINETLDVCRSDEEIITIDNNGYWHVVPLDKNNYKNK